MQTLRDGLKKLEATDRRIEQATREVERQAREVADVQRRGESTASALHLLSVMQGTLATWCAHRVLVTQELERLAGDAFEHKAGPTRAGSGSRDSTRRNWRS
jgi:hypothetical protein